MEMSEEDCPVCKDKIKEPSQPSACCGKVICQSCLNNSLHYRAHCPHCRSLNSNPSPRSDVRQRVQLPILPGNSEIFNVGRPVGRNLQSIIGQLQAGQDQTSTADQTYQNVPAPVPFPPLPQPQSRGYELMLPAQQGPSASLPPRSDRYSHLHNPTSPNITPAPMAQLNPNPAQEDLEAELDEWPWQTEITLMEINRPQQSQRSTVRTFTCPYCQEDGFDELDLRDHCNDKHADDRRPVVCPVCVALPHGDPQYYSRNFIRHLNLRHCYYTEDFTNIDQSDEMNIQVVLMASFGKNN